MAFANSQQVFEGFTMSTFQEIQAQIKELQQQAEALLQSERQPVIERILEDIKNFGITAKELGFKTPKTRSKPTQAVESIQKKPVPPKFKHGELTWTGRGRTPKWIIEYELNGGKKSDLEVKLS